MTKKPKLPSDAEIKNKMNGFSLLIDRVLSNEVQLKQNRETVTDKLTLINEQLLKLKDQGIAYSRLAKLLEDELNILVSEQTLRSYCQEKLGFPKRGSKKTVLKQASVINSKDINEAKIKLSSDDKFE